MKIENGVLSEVNNSEIVNGKFIIPDSVTEIRRDAFYDCENLTSIIIPNSVIKIKGYAFYNCKNLESITIPDSVIEIGYSSFSNCENLDEININKNNKHYYSENGILFNKNKTVLIKYPEGKKDKKYIVPKSVIKIGDVSFFSCNWLSSIIIPNSVTEIGEYAFDNCYNLKNIIIPNSTIKIGNFSFAGCYNLKNIIIPNSIIKIGNFSFADCENLKSKKGNYKAFEKGLICNNMQYIPNEWNIIEGNIKLCEWGLHYVTNLFDIFNYYYGDLEEDIEIWEVEVGDIIVDHKDGSKKATNAIKPIRKLSIEEVINILNNK